MPDFLTDCAIAAEKLSFCSVRSVIGLERLIWRGRGTPRSLDRNVWSSRLPSGTIFRAKFVIKVLSESYSVVAGNPHMGQQVITIIESSRIMIENLHSMYRCVGQFPST